MRMLLSCLLIVVFALSSAVSIAQQPSSSDLAALAKQEFLAENFPKAERYLRELVKRDPGNIQMQMYLGHTLFRQQKYAEAVAAYAQALTLEKKGAELSRMEHRILIDQLAMAYGISGQLSESKKLLQTAIAEDPEYPLNYYNLACAHAESGNKTDALKNIELAFEHKEHVIQGEEMPNPKEDSSFKKYLGDKDFIELMKKLSLN
jgi:predicted Zn-dependent protease